MDNCTTYDFIPVSLYDDTRWHNHPDQIQASKDNNGRFYFDMKPYFKASIDPYTASEATGDWTNTPGSPQGSPPLQPIYRHNFNCDTITITLRYVSDEKYVSTPIGNGYDVTVEPYMPNTYSITIFKNGRKLSDSEYVELNSTTVSFNEIVQPTDVLSIQYGVAILTEDEHFEIINNNIVRFLGEYIFDFPITDMTIWGWRTNKEAQNPMQLIDKKAKVVVKTIQHWNPDYGYHFVEPHKNVDIEKGYDPAVYTNAVVDTNEGNGFVPWNDERIGTIWLDTSDMMYAHYNDPRAITDCKERIKLWGQLAPTSEVRVYEWVKSNVTPDVWNVLGQVEENNLNILESDRKSGFAWLPIFEKDANDEWIEFRKQYDIFDVAVEGIVLDSPANAYMFNTIFRDDEDEKATINVYVNGILHSENISIPEDGNVTVTSLKEADRVYFVRIPTTNLELIESLIDDEILLRQYQYTLDTGYDYVGNQTDVYFFWVRSKVTKPNIPDKTMASNFIESNLVNSTEPYCFFNKPMPPYFVQYEDDYIEIPWRMVQFVIRGLYGMIDADRRYVLRFFRDFTLRDKLNHGKTALQLKNLHEEWKMFRQEQKSPIDRELWDKITECIIGRKINNANEPVPSYDRQIFDVTYNAQTQYGLENGQAFCDGALAKASILDYLTDRDNIFTPLDITLFFRNHSFDTAEKTIIAMDTIYSTFGYTHINNIFFSILMDALSVKDEYPGIMKTSSVALHSIILLDDRGQFDD